MGVHVTVPMVVHVLVIVREIIRRKKFISALSSFLFYERSIAESRARSQPKTQEGIPCAAFRSTRRGKKALIVSAVSPEKAGIRRFRSFLDSCRSLSASGGFIRLKWIYPPEAGKSRAESKTVRTTKHS
jgi:hypothetical protein